MNASIRAVGLELKPDPHVGAGKIRLKVIDPSGRPVEGAMVGRSARWDDYPASWKVGTGLFVFSAIGLARRTGRGGAILLGKGEIVPEGMPADRPSPLVVLHGERRIGAIGEIHPASGGRSGTVTLGPWTRVRGKLTSTSLTRLGRKLQGAHLEVHLGVLSPLESMSNRSRYDLLVPSGKITLRAYSGNTYSGWKKLTVKLGQKTITVDMDAPADRISRLIGKPAPELRHIKAWNRFGPTTMKALRGKVVILDFWAVWCGPCVHCMPTLMEIHDTYRHRGLEIVAIHTAEMKSRQALEAACKDIAKQVWSGRDLPFRCAIDGGGKTHIPGLPKLERFRMDSHLVAMYGIRRYPTSILIDRQGRVVGEFEPRTDAKHIARQLEPVLEDAET